MRRPNWTERCAWIGDKLANRLRDVGHVTAARADPRGQYGSLSPAHLLFMAETLGRQELGSETKACRWLGWLQAGMVNLGMLTLEDMKQMNLMSGSIMVDAVSAVDSPAPGGQGGATNQGDKT